MLESAPLPNSRNIVSTIFPNYISTSPYAYRLSRPNPRLARSTYYDQFADGKAGSRTCYLASHLADDYEKCHRGAPDAHGQ